MKILHLARDEKFIDMGIRPFEALYPNCNELLLIGDIKFFECSVSIPSYILSKRDLKKKSQQLNFWKSIDVVIFHSLCAHDVTIPPGIKVIWLGFGFDYYNLIFLNNLDFFNKKTKEIVLKKNKQEKLKNHIKTLVKKITLRNYFTIKKRNKLIERVDFFCPVLTTEYQLIRWPVKDKPELMDWNYGTMEDDWAKNSALKLNGHNILLGNSSTFSNNHIDMIDLLSKVASFNSKLIIPLSYGDKDCSQIVKEYATEHYPGEVFALDGFMKFDDYIKLISSCSIVIMGHKRQQGLGNIITMINLGAKVFLDVSNPIYEFLMSRGVTVFSLEEIYKPDFQVELKESQIFNNRKILLDIWGQDSILNKTKKLIECELNKVSK